MLLLGGAFGAIQSTEELQSFKRETATLIYSQEDKLIGKIFSKNRTDISFDALPPHLVNALIATEDARFYEHEGIDSRSVIRVLVKTIFLGNKSAGGGSTLSQQLTKNIFGREEYGKFSIYVNKFKEIILAYRIEQAFKKNEIIELYLNTVPFGEDIYGIEAASQRFFDKTTSQLKVEESAVLIGLLKANSYYNPRKNPEHALNRRQVVLSQMEKYDYINARELDSLKALPLKLNYTNLNRNNPAPYYLNRVEKEAQSILSQLNGDSLTYNLKTDGLIIRTTLNYQLQQLATEIMAKHLQAMQKILRQQYLSPSYSKKLESMARKYAIQNGIPLDNDSVKHRDLFQWDDRDSLPPMNVLDSLKYILTQLHAGFLALDTKDGAVLSWVGGINYQYYPFDQILAKRQIASTFKPILYAAALKNGAQVCDYLSNEAVVLSDFEDWSPQNYEQESGGEYSLAAALAQSKNIPTLHLYFKTPWEDIESLWNKMGFMESLEKNPSVIYGSNSASIFELAIAYSAFANQGKSVEPYLIKSIETSDGQLIYKRNNFHKREILDKEIVKNINEILIKATNDGTGASIRTKYGYYKPWAGKTGTSQNFADAWYIGYNQEILMVSRVGASFPSIHFNSGTYGSASRLALPIVGGILAQSKPFSWYNAGLIHSNEINCEDFREISGFKKFFNAFRKKNTTLEQQKRKANKRKKGKGLFRKTFGK